MILRLLFLALLFSATLQAATPQEITAQLQAGDKRALANAEAYAKANPKNAEAWTLLTRARVMQGKSEAAVTAGEKAVTLAPNSAQAQFWLGNAYGNRIQIAQRYSFLFQQICNPRQKVLACARTQ